MPSSMSDWEFYVDKCRAAFRQHCIERHNLGEYEIVQVWLDVVHWTLELVKD